MKRTALLIRESVFAAPNILTGYSRTYDPQTGQTVSGLKIVIGSGLNSKNNMVSHQRIFLFGEGREAGGCLRWTGIKCFVHMNMLSTDRCVLSYSNG